MNKNKKRTASGLILAGTSLASIAGQAAINVNAEGSIFGSIKNFFTQSKNKREGTKVEDSLKLQKQKIIDLKKKGINTGDIFCWRDLLKLFFASSFSAIVSFIAPRVAAKYQLTENVLKLAGLTLLPMIGAACYADYVLNNNTFFKEVEKACANVKGKIKEDMLNKQYTLKEFEDIVKDDEECSEFIRQLLVLERNPDEIDDEGYKLLDNGGELENAKEVLKKLFLEVDSVDKINELKKLPLQRKEKLLKVIKPLFEWVQGDMPSLFGEGNCFFVQNDSEFCSKVSLLRDALDDEYYIF